MAFVNGVTTKQYQRVQNVTQMHPQATRCAVCNMLSIHPRPELVIHDVAITASGLGVTDIAEHVMCRSPKRGCKDALTDDSQKDASGNAQQLVQENQSLCAAEYLST